MEEESTVDLAFQLSLAPSLLDGDAEVEFPPFRTLTLSKNDEVMGPR